jgi:hypothetical protein
MAVPIELLEASLAQAFEELRSARWQFEHLNKHYRGPLEKVPLGALLDELERRKSPELEITGVHVRQLRKQLGWTQMEVAKAAKCMATYVSGVETGAKPDRDHKIYRLLKGLLDARNKTTELQSAGPGDRPEGGAGGEGQGLGARTG